MPRLSRRDLGVALSSLRRGHCRLNSNLQRIACHTIGTCDTCKVSIKFCFTLFSDHKEMASSYDIGDSLEILTCPVCFDLYKEPIALPCGHSFCRVCIETSWENEEEDKCCVCPNCREIFPQKPKLKKNVIIANLVEKMKFKKRKVELGVDVRHAEHGYAKSRCNESQCELCYREASKRCVPCEILCCEQHLKPHQQKGHKLVDPGVKLEERRCTEHGKPILLYCKDDGSLICVTSMGGDHQNHNVVGVEIAHAELKGVLAAKYPRVSESMQSVASQLQQVQEEEEQTENLSRDAEDRLEEKRSLVCQFVNESMDLMKSEINKRKMEKLSLLGKEREKLEQQMEYLHQGKSTMDTALQELEAVSFLQCSKDLLKWVETMSDFKSVKTTPLPVLDFSKEEKNLDVLIKLNKNFLEKIKTISTEGPVGHPKKVELDKNIFRKLSRVRYTDLSVLSDLAIRSPNIRGPHVFAVDKMRPASTLAALCPVYSWFFAGAKNIFDWEAFMGRHGLSIRRRTHIAQSFPDDIAEKYANFQKFVIKFRKQHDVFVAQHAVRVCVAFIDSLVLRPHRCCSSILCESVFMFLDYGRTPSLDPNSANRRIKISWDLKTATRTEINNRYPEHPDRFDNCPQVVSSDCFSSGRHYWEVDVRSTLSVPRDPERVGFFLDCEAGELTCLGDSRVLHVFRGNFMDLVKTAIQVHDGSVRFSSF
uniref:E3 ubiquitin/ISG15 ligase TRIM25-like n=1 Tax=Myxine glutinosa TaxID=7769 RepID=UPI00358ED199